MSYIEDRNIYKVLPAVKEVRCLQRIGTDWIGSIMTWPNFNKQPVAVQILIAATKQCAAITRFAVQLNDGSSQTTHSISWFSFDTRTGTWLKSNTAPDWVDAYVA